MSDVQLESLQSVPYSLQSTKINDHKPSPTISKRLTISVSLYLDVNLRFCSTVSISDIIRISSQAQASTWVWHFDLSFGRKRNKTTLTNRSF